MSNTPAEQELHKDIQIHIHEHVGPLRERVGKIEGRLEVSEREITLLRHSIDALRIKIEDTREAIISAFNAHTADELTRYDRLLKASNGTDSKVTALRNWVLAIGIGMGAIIAIFDLFAKLGMIQHGS